MARLFVPLDTKKWDTLWCWWSCESGDAPGYHYYWFQQKYFNPTAFPMPGASEPGEEKDKKVIKQLLPVIMLCKNVVEAKDKENVWADLDHLSPFKTQHQAGAVIYIYVFSAHRTIGKDQQPSQNFQMAADFGESVWEPLICSSPTPFADSPPQREISSSLSTFGHGNGQSFWGCSAEGLCSAR